MKKKLFIGEEKWKFRDEKHINEIKSPHPLIPTTHKMTNYVVWSTFHPKLITTRFLLQNKKEILLTRAKEENKKHLQQLHEKVIEDNNKNPEKYFSRRGT